MPVPPPRRRGRPPASRPPSSSRSRGPTAWPRSRPGGGCSRHASSLVTPVVSAAVGGDVDVEGQESDAEAATHSLLRTSLLPLRPAASSTRSSSVPAATRSRRSLRTIGFWRPRTDAGAHEATCTTRSPDSRHPTRIPDPGGAADPRVTSTEACSPCDQAARSPVNSAGCSLVADVRRARTATTPGSRTGRCSSRTHSRPEPSHSTSRRTASLAPVGTAQG